MTESNASLAARACDDRAALAQLLRRHQAAVFRICLGRLKHRQDAEDMTQETFARATRYIDRFDPGRPFGPWLISIAGNRCRSFLAKRARAPATSVVVEPACERGGLERDASTLQEELDLALTQLPANHRSAFELFHRDGLDYAEMAKRLHCPIGTAKTWVHRARVGLIEHLRQREVLVAIERTSSPVDPPGTETRNRQAGQRESRR